MEVLALAVLALAMGGVFKFMSREAGGKGSSEPAPTDVAMPVDARGPVPPHMGALTTRNAAGRSGAFYVPAQPGGRRADVLVALHGTDGSGQMMVDTFRQLADAHGFAIVAPDSRRAPGGRWSWEVGDKPGDVTPDLEHTLSCLHEVLARFPERLEPDSSLIVGYSGGGSSAPYIGSNRPPFAAVAVLHGGVFPGGLGRRRVRAWFSTGSHDPMRPPTAVRDAATAAERAGMADVSYHEFPGDHGIGEAEKTALIRWWLQRS